MKKWLLTKLSKDKSRRLKKREKGFKIFPKNSNKLKQGLIKTFPNSTGTCRAKSAFSGKSKTLLSALRSNSKDSHPTKPSKNLMLSLKKNYIKTPNYPNPDAIFFRVNKNKTGRSDIQKRSWFELICFAYLKWIDWLIKKQNHFAMLSGNSCE